MMRVLNPADTGQAAQELASRLRISFGRAGTTGDATGNRAGILIIFFCFEPVFWPVSPTFAVLSQTAGSGVPTG